MHVALWGGACRTRARSSRAPGCMTTHLYDWFGLNVALFQLINALHTGWWDRLMLAMSWLGDHPRYPWYMAAALLLSWTRRQWMPQRNVVSFGAGYPLNVFLVGFIKARLDMPRPLLLLGRSVVTVGPPEFHHSFPSAAAAFSVFLATALSSHAPRPLRWTLWAYAAMVCLARVSVGAHFPADVVGGAMIGVTAAGAISVLLRLLKRIGG